MVEDTVLLVNVNFALGSCQVAQVTWTIRFKARVAKFEKGFTVCELGVRLN